MAVAVYLDFTPPNDIPDITTLHILEAVTPDGPFAEIDSVVGVGEQGSYLSNYTTANANSADNWFAIQWENSKGWTTELSEPVQGSTTSVVAEITSRVLLRNPEINEEIAAQEAEAVVEEITGSVSPDPSTISRKKMSGMVLLTMARSLMSGLLGQSEASSWSAGLVSVKADSSSKASLDDIAALTKEAGRLLGISGSRVAQMCMPTIAYGLAEIVTADISRLMIEVE